MWRGDPGEANDSQEEIQEFTVNQLQGQEGDPGLQCPPLLGLQRPMRRHVFWQRDRISCRSLVFSGTGHSVWGRHGATV